MDNHTENRRWTTVIASLAAALMTLDITVVNVALPQIGQDLHASLDSLQWVINGYTLSFAALLLLAGALSDRIGRLRIFMSGILLFTVASLVCALAPSAAMLIAARIVQGIGGAMVLGTALALIAGACAGQPAQVRASAIGLFAAGGAFAAATGPLIGGMLVEWASWPWLFAINVPIGLLILLLAQYKVSEQRPSPPKHRLDWPGALLVTVSLFSLNFAALAGAERGWQAPGVGPALLLGGVGALLFLVVERRQGPAALLDLSLFRIPTFVGAILLSFFGRILSFGLLPFITLWLSGMLGYSPLHIGLILLCQSLAMVVAAGVSGPLSKRIPVRILLTLGMFIVAVGLFWSSHIQVDSDWLQILPMLVMLGIGAGLTLPHLMDLAVSVVPAARAGTASGTANTFFPLGTAVGIALFGVLLSRQLGLAITPEILLAQGITAPQPILSAIAAAQFPALENTLCQLHAPLLATALQAWVDGLNLLFQVAAVASTLAGFSCLWLIREKDVYRAQSTGCS